MDAAECVVDAFRPVALQPLCYVRVDVQRHHHAAMTCASLRDFWMDTLFEQPDYLIMPAGMRGKVLNPGALGQCDDPLRKAIGVIQATIEIWKQQRIR